MDRVHGLNHLEGYGESPGPSVNLPPFAEGMEFGANWPT